MAALHNFKERLAFSHAQSEQPFWFEVYRKAFPSLRAAVDVRADGWAQRGGIDRVLTLDSGRTISVDEKVREKAYPDFCLEYYSDEAGKIRGWVCKDLACDYIAYAFLPTQTCYLLPFLELRRAWRENAKHWIERFPKIKAKNSGYVTASVGVPIDVLLDAISQSQIIRWESKVAA